MEITANILEAALRQLSGLSAPVSRWHVETGSDSTDDPAVWVWATLKDDDVEFAKRSQLRSIIRKFAEKKNGPSMLVYIRFRAASEVEHQA